jgi:hypothetical protein
VGEPVVFIRSLQVRDRNGMIISMPSEKIVNCPLRSATKSFMSMRVFYITIMAASILGFQNMIMWSV